MTSLPDLIEAPQLHVAMGIPCQEQERWNECTCNVFLNCLSLFDLIQNYHKIQYDLRRKEEIYDDRVQIHPRSNCHMPYKNIFCYHLKNTMLILL